MTTYHASSFGGMNDWLDGNRLDEKTAKLLSNCVVDDGSITSLSGLKALSGSKVDFGHYGANDRSVVKWYGRHYWSYNSASDTPYYGGNVESLGVPYPTEQPSLTSYKPSSGGLTGFYRYCMCYVNNNGWEGAPGSLSNYETYITLSEQFCKVTSEAWPDGVAYAKVYRTTADGADFYYVGEITESGGTFDDQVTDSVLECNEALESTDNYPPPDGGKYLCESGGVFFVAVGSNLHFSTSGNPHAWPTLNYIGFDDPIVGLVAEFQGVLVFTANNAYRVVGASDASSVTKTLIPGYYGCMDWHSISTVDNAPVWLSNDGLLLWDGQSVSNISRGVVKTSGISVSCSVVSNDVYYLFSKNACLLYDKRNGGVWRKLDFGCDYGWYDGSTDKMYLEQGGVIYDFGSGDALTWHYVSGDVGGSDFGIKRYREIQLVGSGTFSAYAYVDGMCVGLVVDKTLRHARLKLPPSANGRRLSVELYGVGTLREMAVSYE